MGGLSIFAKVVGVLAAVIAFYVGYYFTVLERWEYIQRLNRSDFKATNYTILREDSIPTTYYSPGELGKVLREWPHGKLHLFRVREGEKYEFDLDLFNSTTVARKLDKTCPDLKTNECSHRSTLSTNCMFEMSMTVGEEHVIDAASILTGEGEGYHASFARLANRDSIKNIWNSLKLPFSVDATNFEHAFIMNLPEVTQSAPFHANPLTDSMAVQLVGKKIWMFIPSTTFVDKMKATSGGGALWVKRSPPAELKPELLIYHSQPGDILFFPESWGHSVTTFPGPNLLMNFRKLSLGNILRQPLVWLSTMLEIKLEGDGLTNKDNEAGKLVKSQKIKAVPSRKGNIRIGDMYRDMCDSGRTEFDAQMLSIIDEEVAKVL